MDMLDSSEAQGGPAGNMQMPGNLETGHHTVYHGQSWGCSVAVRLR